jgi:hypothetical protein
MIRNKNEWIMPNIPSTENDSFVPLTELGVSIFLIGSGVRKVGL